MKVFKEFTCNCIFAMIVVSMVSTGCSRKEIPASKLLETYNGQSFIVNALSLGSLAAAEKNGVEVKYSRMIPFYFTGINKSKESAGVKIPISCWYRKLSIKNVTFQSAKERIELKCGNGVDITNKYVEFYIYADTTGVGDEASITITTATDSIVTLPIKKVFKNAIEPTEPYAITYESVSSKITTLQEQWISPRPVIGVTHVAFKPRVMKAVINGGGYPVKFTNFKTPEEGEEVLKRLDGVLMPGSSGVTDEDHYVDLQMSRLCPKNKKWILGLCYGEQMLNIGLGGNIVRISKKWPEAEKHMHLPEEPATPAHEITIDKESRLHSILHCDRLFVNSRHNWVIDTLAPGLKIVARSIPDGMIECIEGDYVTGYQFHPEDFAAKGEQPQLALFQDFIKRVKESRGLEQRQ